ncbi:hypothetical protein [Rheinheimera sp.]|uniref:hypothetical protein n=1 Tax=Rheinheimera sp. TaxID=1869214 RepID=UPI0040489E09
MKGTILNVAETELLLRCTDGNKYTCSLSEVKSSEVKARVGDDVDFEVVEGKAAEVYILRSASTVENFASVASAKANSALNTVKSHITDENKEKLRNMSANAVDSAQKIGGELKDKAGALFSNIKSADGASGFDASSLKKVPNKFSLFALAFFFIFSFTDIAKVERFTFSYYDGTESYLLAILLVVCMVLAALAVNAIVYRVAVAITLFITIKPLIDLYDASSEGLNLAREFGVRLPGLGDLFAHFTTGYIVFFLLGFILTAVTLIPGLYKAKPKAVATVAIG